MAKSSTPLRHQVTSAAGELLGWWTVEGGMLCVRSRHGGVRRVAPGKSNDSVARQLLGEAWAKS